MSRRATAFVVFFILGAGLTTLSGFYTGFHVSSNDYWTVLFYGRHMTLDQTESLYNGFYPFGYAFLIGQLPYTYAIQLSYLINALLAGLFVASVSSLVAANRFLPATIIAIIISLLHPLIFQYNNTPGPDIGTAAFPAFSVYLLWRDAFTGKRPVDSRTTATLIGLTLGLGFLWRTHVIVFSGLVLLLAILFRRIRSRYSIALMTGVFLALVSLQVVVDLVSGHRPFETAQMFNIYKLLFGLNWNLPPTPAEIADFSFLKVLLNDPNFVIKSIFPYFQYLVTFAWPGAVCLLLAPKGPIRGFALFSTLVMFLYSIPLSINDSPRAPLTILPLHLTSLSFILIVIVQRINRYIPSIKCASLVGTIVWIVFNVIPVSRWVMFDWMIISDYRMTNRVFNGIEQVLLSNGMTSPDEVFSNKFRFYIPGRPPFTPRQFSGWYNDWVWGYADKYPSISNESWESFRQSCLDQGIKFIVISPLAEEQGEFFSIIYEDNFDDDLMGLEFITARAKMRIYRFK